MATRKSNPKPESDEVLDQKLDAVNALFGPEIRRLVACKVGRHCWHGTREQATCCWCGFEGVVPKGSRVLPVAEEGAA